MKKIGFYIDAFIVLFFATGLFISSNIKDDIPEKLSNVTFISKTDMNLDENDIYDSKCQDNFELIEILEY
ncbi:hypothetical protein [Aquimarina sp. 2201CG5-10]|uniref:hypothetical protein n=1 Tax=Aquimarina callyspongiae TaxID=3098150 RepID=UPI002AB41D65|nr:hypothetical protein [Aquimarina sp. 2201CG5-10]MDY8134352.1 hypothetical protein [Aquimarina sp. 2201CG5-10]